MKKLLASILTTFAMVVTALSVATAPAHAADYEPTVATYCNVNVGDAERRRIVFHFSVRTNGFGRPDSRVKITLVNRWGRIVKRTGRNYEGGTERYIIGDLNSGMYRLRVHANPHNDRFYACGVGTRVYVRR